MQYARLGTTDLEVSRVGFGTGSLGEFYGALDEPAALRLVQEVIDLGINLIDTSRYYNNAEERLGKAISPAQRDGVAIITKCGRYGPRDFDYSRAGIRKGIEESLRQLRTDHVDVLLMHDLEFVDLSIPFGEGYEELCRVRDEGKTRYIGVSGYPPHTMRRAMTELDIDVVLTYAKGCLLDNSIKDDLVPVAESRGVGLINAAAVAIGLLTPRGVEVGSDHQAPIAVQEAAVRMRALCAEAGVDIGFIANQYAIQRSGCATTVVGVGKSSTLRAAVEAAEAPIDEEFLAKLLALRPSVAERRWQIGLPENN